MPRRLYTLAWHLALPLVAAYLLWRSLRQPEYRQHWAERFRGRGAHFKDAGGPVVWLHAVSVGETRAAEPLIERLAAARPDLRFVLTHMTPTGRAVGEGLARRLAGRLLQRYLPYELPFAVRRFLAEVRPAAGLIMETEIWPNLLAEAGARGLPVVLVNARLSARSLARGRRAAALMRDAAGHLRLVLAQSAADRARLAQFFAGEIEVLGNLKFDLAPPADLMARGRALHADLGERGARPVWLLASSRDGEEALLLDALAQHADAAPVILLVPRHPQRFDEVARLVESRGRACLRRSRQPWPDGAPPAGAVLLGDTMGEMPLYYAAADVTLMGGSFRPFGSQNLIESCAVGTPVILGPSTFNFAQAAQDAVAAGAARQVPDLAAALQAAQSLCADPAQLARMKEAAADFAAAHRGATDRTAARVLALLAASAPAGR